MKKIIKVIFLMSLICASYGHQKGTAVKEKRDLRLLRTLFTSAPQLLQQIYDLSSYLLRNPNAYIKDSILRSKQSEILGHINQISKNIMRLEEKINGNSGEILSKILSSLPVTIKSELRLDEMGKIIDQIDIAQDEFNSYLRPREINLTSDALNATLRRPYVVEEDDLSTDLHGSSYLNAINKRSAEQTETDALVNFAKWATGPGSDSVKSLLGRLHRITVTRGKVLSTGIFDLLNQRFKEYQTARCDMKESPHQTLYNLYRTIILADFKGFAMLQFSYMILNYYDKGNFTSESNREKVKFEKRTAEKSDAIRNALANADRSIYNCDPQQYVEGLTYVKLTKLLQGYVENEVNFNPYNTCQENCAYYKYTEYHGCYKDQFCGKQEQCRGKIIECKYVDSDMNICKSTSSERRYDWIEYENGRVLGNKGKCQMRNFYKVDSWWRYLFWHCSYCLCLCDEGGYTSDRYFNMRPVTSDINNNKIITGVRITKHNKIIHLQIQQGILGPRGMVYKSSLSWKPVDNYTISDKDVINGVDYHTMSWMDRILDIDEAAGSSEQVLTGIRFRKLGYHLNLEIRATPINFTSGQVYSEVYSVWLGNDNTELNLLKPRKEILLTNPDIPIRNGPHILDSEHDQFITFQASSFETDAGQSTVPYFDSQPLMSNGFLLSGLGFIHRGKPGSGGFIAPKLISYDFAPHI